MSRFGDRDFPNLTALESRRLATSAKDGNHGQGEAMESVMEPEDKRVIRQRSQAWQGMHGLHRIGISWALTSGWAMDGVESVDRRPDLWDAAAEAGRWPVISEDRGMMPQMVSRASEKQAEGAGTPRRTGKPVPVQATRRRLSQTLVEAPSAAMSANERGGVRRRNGEGVSDSGTGGGGMDGRMDRWMCQGPQCSGQKQYNAAPGPTRHWAAGMSIGPASWQSLLWELTYISRPWRCFVQLSASPKPARHTHTQTSPFPIRVFLPHSEHEL
ncbi:hypothetical protein COCMIDRAFT_28181 [Bipolaris oryzae ATCC 44560]|uniref:Uncharacterized protein n=1 Tax=Bipolaris oryzae ATCC 44560 TaxID=930090 RepID=W6Z715_COCMI|nr:uncharacterized protein COCMIDRAFT_28181 [Bipolaris oryzae ATCC 44560]EUC43344.1 hypothetical protein COCMIDRAFT_28181 [Bipolaris oryzae ATCC 44560]